MISEVFSNLNDSVILHPKILREKEEIAAGQQITPANKAAASRTGKTGLTKRSRRCRRPGASRVGGRVSGTRSRHISSVYGSLSRGKWTSGGMGRTPVGELAPGCRHVGVPLGQLQL